MDLPHIRQATITVSYNKVKGCKKKWLIKGGTSLKRAHLQEAANPLSLAAIFDRSSPEVSGSYNEV